MNHRLLLAAHLVGAAALGAAIVALWWNDRRIARAGDCGTLAGAGRRAQAIVQRLLLPGVLLLAASGVWLLARYYGWSFVRLPWRAALAALFVVQSVWANTVPRHHAQRLGRLLAGRCATDRLTPELERARRAPLACFGQQLEPLLFALIVAFGLARPMDWVAIAAGVAAAGLLAAALTAYTLRPPASSSFSSASVEAAGRA